MKIRLGGMLPWDKNPSNKICNLFGMETKSLRGALGSRNKCVRVCVCGGRGGGQPAWKEEEEAGPLRGTWRGERNFKPGIGGWLEME